LALPSTFIGATANFNPVKSGLAERIEMRRTALALLGLALAGCGTSTTETGYEPHRLGLTDAQRRALYAPKYSVEQAQAQAERPQESQQRRPGGGAGLGGR
jgi:hypothetical protein